MMKTVLKSSIFLLFVFAFFIPSKVIAQQQGLQDLFLGTKNIFLKVSANELWQAAKSNDPIRVENFCALEGNAGVVKFGDQIKKKDTLGFTEAPGDFIIWRGQVDPYSHARYDISINQVVVKELDGQNIFTSYYLPEKNGKVSAEIREDIKQDSGVRYDIIFSLHKRNSDSTQVFTLDPWIFVKR